jgi:hypothetical protein
LNIVHFYCIHLNIVQISLEVMEMQTLVLEIASTFADDAMAFMKGSGRLALHAVTAPVERLARACDVAGVLGQRRTAHRSQTAGSDRGSPNSQRRRRWFRCRSPFRSLSELT